jgi:hypothetical protein
MTVREPVRKAFGTRWRSKVGYTAALTSSTEIGKLSTGDPPTAMVCGNDYLEIGCALQARAMGLDVPRDVSATSFDDIDMARLLDPGLVTMRDSDLAATLGGDHGLGLHVGDGLAQVVAVIGFVGEHGTSLLALQKIGSSGDVTGIARCDQKPQGTAKRVEAHVDLGGQSTSPAPAKSNRLVTRKSARPCELVGSAS